MKGLVLAGGSGSRLRPLTFTGAKQLIPVANRPILHRVLDDLQRAGIREVGIVVGDTADQIRASVGDGSAWQANVTYIPQEAPLGLAHAVKISREFLGDDPFLMYLGDNLIQDGVGGLVDRFLSSDWNVQIVLKEVEDPRAYGVAELRDGRVVRLVEKPPDPPSNLALVGIYMFDPTVWEAVEAIRPSWRGELEITDAIQHLIEQGRQVVPFIQEGYWIDTGKKEDLLEANRLLLDEIRPSLGGRVDEQSRVNGKVVIEEGTQIIHSVVRGPAAIGRDCRIVDAYIGPYTSIYHNVVIEQAEIENSMILEDSVVSDVPHRIEDSLIGRSVEVHRSSIKPKAYKMTLGDHSKVGIL